jgi:N-acetylmuramoyl-L-alanine amidase
MGVCLAAGMLLACAGAAGQEEPAAGEGEALAPELAAPAAEPALSPSLAELPAGRLAFDVIVIDPGHGESDPGQTGPNGVQEKSVAYSLAEKLQAALTERLDVTVLLTREGDVYLPDAARSRFAALHKGDLLISLHCGASYNDSASGIDVFYPQGGARGRTANRSGRMSASERRLIAEQSESLARAVAAALGEAVTMPVRGVHPAPCRVLVRAGLPGILIEAGCITNPMDEQLLGHEDFLNSLALGIARGVERYGGVKRAEGEAP